MKYGFEREYFVKKGEAFVLAPKELPHDGCGFLVEARGDAHEDPLKAAHLLLAEEHRLQLEAKKRGLELVLIDAMKLDPELRRQALQQFGKSPLPHERGSMYGKDYKATDRLSRAGLHVHFSNQQTVFFTSPACEHCKQSKKDERTVAGSLEMPKYIRMLDEAFATQIKDAKRIPGLYEMKTHGFEYRSLPTSVDPIAVADVLRGVVLEDDEDDVVDGEEG